MDKANPVAAPTSDIWALEGSVENGPDGRPRMLGGQCAGCGEKMFPQPKMCPRCWSEDIATVPLASRGKLYSFSVLHIARQGWKTPYVIAYVDLEDGVRVCAPLDCDVASPPPLDSLVHLTTGVLRTQPDGSPVLSHRFVAGAVR